MAHPARRRVSLRGLLSALATLLFVAALAAGGWVWFDYRNFSDAPLHIASADATLDIPPGTAFLGIVRRVREGGYSALSCDPRELAAALVNHLAEQCQ